MKVNAPVVAHQEPSRTMVFVQIVLIIVLHVAPQLNVKFVRMVSNYRKVNVFQSVLMEHLLKKETVLTAQKLVLLAKMKKLVTVVKKDHIFQVPLALVIVQLEHIAMRKTIAVVHALMVAHNVKAMTNVLYAKMALH